MLYYATSNSTFLMSSPLIKINTYYGYYTLRLQDNTELSLYHNVFNRERVNHQCKMRQGFEIPVIRVY